MEAELRRIRELYDPRRDSTDIFARQYRLPTHDEEVLSVQPSETYENGSTVLPPYSVRTPVKPANLHTKPASQQPDCHGIQYSEEERMLHFDPTYRPHRRLIRVGHAATIIFAITFILSATAFAIHLVGKQYIYYPTKIIQTVLASIGVGMYLLRALVNWRVKEALGRVLGQSGDWGCEKHMECSEQRYRLYGGKRLEIAFGSLVVLMVAFCGVSWVVKF
ncbi:hypothetical protein TWF281_003630 [Arthrobotrys megalospora]